MNLLRRLGRVIDKSDSYGKVFAALVLVGAAIFGVILLIVFAFFLHPLAGLTALGVVLARLTFFALEEER